MMPYKVALNKHVRIKLHAHLRYNTGRTFPVVGVLLAGTAVAYIFLNEIQQYEATPNGKLSCRVCFHDQQLCPQSCYRKKRSRFNVRSTGNRNWKSC